MAEDFYGTEDKGEISKFNPAALKMMRISDISRQLNYVKLNLSAWNIEWGDWNYNLYLKLSKILYGEVFIKFAETEKKDCEKLRKALKFLLDKFPIRRKLRNGKWTNANEATLRVFEENINKYEEKVKEYQDAHGLDTPNREDEEGE